MALVAQLTKISINESKLPSGYTDPAGVNLASSQPTYENLRINVDKATVENAVKATTFDAIRTDAVVGIEKQVADLIGNDFDDTLNTVTYNIDWKDVRNNQPISEEFYTDSAVEYVNIVNVYVVVS